METKKSKYDTNPLDPDFVKNTEEVWGEGGGGPETQEVTGTTREVAPQNHENPRGNVYSEAPTRRYDNVPLDAPYPSIFVPPTYSQPPVYQPPPATPYTPPPQQYSPTRSVSGIGLPEKWALVLPYLPSFIGVVPALLWLFLIPRREAKVRFHASQALALHVAILVIQTLFGVIGTITGSSIGGKLFSAAAAIFLIISMVRILKGESPHIAPLNDATKWFNEKIDPRNKS